MAVSYKVRFRVDRAGHVKGDVVQMTSGAAERLFQRGVVEILAMGGPVQGTASETNSGPVTPAPQPATPKRRGRPPKVK